MNQKDTYLATSHGDSSTGTRILQSVVSPVAASDAAAAVYESPSLNSENTGSYVQVVVQKHRRGREGERVARASSPVALDRPCNPAVRDAATWTEAVRYPTASCVRCGINSACSNMRAAGDARIVTPGNNVYVPLPDECAGENPALGKTQKTDKVSSRGSSVSSTASARKAAEARHLRRLAEVEENVAEAKKKALVAEYEAELAAIASATSSQAEEGTVMHPQPVVVDEVPLKAASATHLPPAHSTHKKCGLYGLNNQKEPMWKELECQTNCNLDWEENGPECLAVYYFERGNGEFLCGSAGSHRPLPAVERVVRRAAQRASWLLAELLAPPRLAVSLPLHSVIELERWSLSVVRGVICGTVQTVGDYLLKPTLAITFNALVRPPLVFLANATSAVRDGLRPFWQIVEDAMEPVARLLGSIRLVQINVQSGPARQLAQV